MPLCPDSTRSTGGHEPAPGTYRQLHCIVYACSDLYDTPEMTDLKQDAPRRPTSRRLMLSLVSVGASIACDAIGVWLLFHRVDWTR